MKRNPYLPGDDPGKSMWLNNFAAKIITYGATVGITPTEVTSIGADAVQFAFFLNGLSAYRPWLKQLTTQKNVLRDAPPGATPIVFMPPPMVTAPTPAVAAGIFARVAMYVQRIKNSTGCTDAIAADLGIVGSEETVDLGAMQPSLKNNFIAGHPNILWTKAQMDALELEVDRTGTGFIPLAIDTQPDYLDTAPLPAPGVSETWKYRAIYRLNDEQVGSWSDTLVVAVLGV